MTPESFAQYFHEQYEKLAPAFGYETRKASAVPFNELPENNRKLMIAVATLALEKTERYFDQLFAMRSRIQQFVGRYVYLDLGQIGPSRLKLLSIKNDVVTLKYESTGKEITLDIKTIYEQTR